MTDTTSASTSSAPQLGAWATFGEPRSAIDLVAGGMDWVCLDGQHGRFDDASVRETLSLRRGHDVPIIVRVPANDVTLIGRALDAGADGIIVPMVQDAEQAEYAVSSAHYPPRGTRSFGPMSGADYGTDTGIPGRPFVAVMVETQRALDAVDQIAATPDLDMIFVGPFDLSLALGRKVDEMVGDESDASPLRRVVAACEAAGIIPGAFAGEPDRARQMLGHGFRWVAAASDGLLLKTGARAVREQLDAKA